MKEKEIMPTLEVQEVPVEVVEKKSNFFKDLISATSGASSKRFVGLMFSGVFAVCSIVAVAGVEFTDNALELIKMEGVLGVSLLGLNGVQQMIGSFKK